MARSFNGSSDRIALVDTGGLAFERTQAISVAGWVNTSTTATAQTILSRMNFGTPCGWSFFVRPTLQIALDMLANTGGTRMLAVTANSTVPSGSWAHMVATYPGDSNRHHSR